MILTFSGALNLDIITEVQSLASVSDIVGEKLVPGREYIISYNTLQRLKVLIETGAEVRYVGGGGSAANTCVALARLGHETSFLGTCGADDLGDLVLSSMKGVDIQNVKRVNKTSSCIIFLTKDHKDRTILVAPAQHSYKMGGCGKIEFLHLSSLPSEEGLRFHRELVRGLAPHSLLTLDPGEIYCKMGIEALRHILTRTNCLFLTSREYEVLFKGTGPMDVLRLLSRATPQKLTLGFPRALVVKRGAEGATCILDQGQFQLDAEPVGEVVDNTGAGDAFNAGFIHAWLCGAGASECLRAANRLAALSIRDWGRNWLGRLRSDDKVWMVDHRKG